ncbi:MAG: nicotinate-nucleotide adenylyltransferase [Lewinellaceae bacterium]|nr:nicotinate-nucleotide adenylyltransferase [Lewinellaceae bacterium]
MKVGLFFGSFNPVHIGHMIIADYMVEFTGLEQVWMVVSPHNPLKPKQTLAPDYDRLHLVRLAIGDHPKLRASDIEFYLDKPSYTVDTLAYLREKYPDKEFALIMGGDNLMSLPKWKNYEFLLANYPIYVYRRPRYEDETLAQHPNVRVFDAPLLDISASFVRECRKTGKSIRYLLPESVYQYLETSHLYRK